MAASRGVDGHAALDRGTRDWARGLPLPEHFWIHDDVPAALAANALGCPAFTRGDHVYLGAVPAAVRSHVLRHELVHLAQVQLAHRTGRVDLREDVELEAERLARADRAGSVRCAAHPERSYGFWWVPVGIGVYILLRPSVANAPAPDSRLRRSPSLGQIATEAVVFMVVPGGACALGARIGLGFWGTAILGGAVAAPSTRLVDNAFTGEFQPPLFYVYDIATGAILGFVVPGGVRLVGHYGTMALDRLATFGLSRAQIAVTEVLHEAALATPLEAPQVYDILAQQGLAARISQWWLDRRNLMILYRGQTAVTTELLSPLAREEGVIASDALVKRMRLAGLTEEEIAGYSAMHADVAIARGFAPSHLVGERLGATGIPTTTLPGIASGFAKDGVVYVLRMPRSEVIKPLIWQNLELEFEHTILNSVPHGSIVKMLPVSRIAPLEVNGLGQLVPK
ncbi:MAG TPA: DUF4157 domain-containing protein [Polyangiales bacterium]|nr:DUF4157 domain-containing protein [Polyangiales bacterium]